MDVDSFFLEPESIPDSLSRSITTTRSVQVVIDTTKIVEFGASFHQSEYRTVDGGSYKEDSRLSANEQIKYRLIAAGRKKDFAKHTYYSITAGQLGWLKS